MKSVPRPAEQRRSRSRCRKSAAEDVHVRVAPPATTSRRARNIRNVTAVDSPAGAQRTPPLFSTRQPSAFQPPSERETSAERRAVPDLLPPKAVRQAILTEKLPSPRPSPISTETVPPDALTIRPSFTAAMMPLASPRRSLLADALLFPAIALTQELASDSTRRAPTPLPLDPGSLAGSASFDSTVTGLAGSLERGGATGSGACVRTGSGLVPSGVCGRVCEGFGDFVVGVGEAGGVGVFTGAGSPAVAGRLAPSFVANTWVRGAVWVTLPMMGVRCDAATESAIRELSAALSPVLFVTSGADRNAAAPRPAAMTRQAAMTYTRQSRGAFATTAAAAPLIGSTEKLSGVISSSTREKSVADA